MGQTAKLSPRSLEFASWLFREVSSKSRDPPGEVDAQEWGGYSTLLGWGSCTVSVEEFDPPKVSKLTFAYAAAYSPLRQCLPKSTNETSVFTGSKE